MRQGNDIGTQYRSGIYPANDAQAAAAEASREAYQQALSGQGLRQDHHRDRAGRPVLFRRGLSPAVPGQEPGRLLRHRRHRRDLPDRRRRRGLTSERCRDGADRQPGMTREDVEAAPGAAGGDAGRPVGRRPTSTRSAARCSPICGLAGGLSFKVSEIGFEVLTESGPGRQAPYLAKGHWVLRRPGRARRRRGRELARRPPTP